MVAREAFLNAVKAADRALTNLYATIPDLTDADRDAARRVMMFGPASIELALPVFDADDDYPIDVVRGEETARALLAETRSKALLPLPKRSDGVVLTNESVNDVAARVLSERGVSTYRAVTAVFGMPPDEVADSAELKRLSRRKRRILGERRERLERQANEVTAALLGLVRVLAARSPMTEAVEHAVVEALRVIEASRPPDVTP